MRPWFRSWVNHMMSWFRYEGVFKVPKADAKERDKFIFQIPQKDEKVSFGYTISQKKISREYDDEDKAARAFDIELVAIGLKAVNFPDEESEDDEGPPALYFRVDEEGNVFLQARPKPGEKIDLNGLSMEEWDNLYKDACESGVSEGKASMLKSYLCGLIEEQRQEFEKGEAEVRTSSILDIRVSSLSSCAPARK